MDSTRSDFQPKNIIVRMPNWLGDFVMATPILHDLSLCYPNASVTAMCHASLAPVAKEHTSADNIFSFSQPTKWLRRLHDRNLIHRLQQGQYDLGILLTNSLSSAWWFWRGNVKCRVGFEGNCRSFLLDKPVCFPPLKEKQHLVKTYKALLEPFGIPISSTAPKLNITQQHLQNIEPLLKRFEITKNSIVVGINIGAAYGSAKCWLPDRFHSLTKRLLENPRVIVLFFGDHAGKPLVDSVCAGLPNRAVNLAGMTTLSELVTLIKKCDAFLTNDSGPMHIAYAVGTPLLALFGSTSDVKTGPYKTGTVLHKHVECSPCYKRRCPLDFRCMKLIQKSEVYEALVELIERH